MVKLGRPKGPLNLWVYNFVRHADRSFFPRVSHRMFALILTGLFLLSAALVASRHELWRDEMQAWLIARDSPTVLDILRQARYEGAPPLWHLALRVLSHLCRRPETMQVFNVLL